MIFARFSFFQIVFLILPKKQDSSDGSRLSPIFHFKFCVPYSITLECYSQFQCLDLSFSSKTQNGPMNESYQNVITGPPPTPRK